MATINIEAGDIPDLLISTLSDLQKGVWYQEFADIQDYPIARMLMEGGVGKEGSGRSCTFRMADDPGDADGHYGLYTDFDVDRGEHLVEGTVPWRHIRHGFAVDEHEVSMNSGEAQIVDDMDVQRSAMWQRLSNDIESGAWQVPSSADGLLERGIPYYVPWSSTALGTFNGSGLPAGHTSVAGITPSAHPKYVPYADTYTNPTKADLGVKLMKMIRQINFRPAPNVKAEQTGKNRMYMGNEVLQDLETLAANQNDQLGFDIGAAMDNTVLKRTPLMWVPQLDTSAAAAADPIYVINHSYLYPKFLKGWRFKEYPPAPLPKQRTAIGIEAHVTFNWVAPIRRRLGVIAKSAPFGEA